MIEKSWEGPRAFYELAFGSWIAYLFLLFLWKKILRAEHEGWKYALITLVGGSFYIINHYFFNAPFYFPLIGNYAVLFFIVYYCLLVKPLTCSLVKKTAAFLSAVIFTLVYIMAENVARFLAQGSLIPGVHVPEFIFIVISYAAFVIIIIFYGRKK